MTDPYEQLAALAQVELELATGGALEALALVQAESGQLAATLPAEPPAQARAALERAAALQELASAAIGQQLASVRDQLGRLEHGRGAISGYAVKQEPRARVDCAG